MQVKFNEALRIAVNSLSEGIIDKHSAIEMVENAANGRCDECGDKTATDLSVCLMTLERAVDDEIDKIINMDEEYPLDSMMVEDAVRLHDKKGMVLHCEDGHILGIYKEPVEEKSNEMEVGSHGEGQRTACI